MTLAAVALLVVSAILVGDINGDGEAEILRAAHEHSSAVTLSSVLQAIAFALLVAPLVSLSTAARARSSRGRPQLIGLVTAAPLSLAAASVPTAVPTNAAPSAFVGGGATATLTAKEATNEC